MKRLALVAFLCVSLGLCAQGGFEISGDRTQCTVPFKLINNLIFVKVKLNGVPLTFLLDTGVEETMLFSLEQGAEVTISDSEKITLKGLGSEDPVHGLKSRNNTLSVGKLIDEHHLVYIVLGRDFNLSSHVGIPVHGILGQRFFANHLVFIDYSAKRVKVYERSESLLERKFSDFEKLPMPVERSKPYLVSQIHGEAGEFPAKLLIDTGNSDAVWLFEGKSPKVRIPDNHIEDYLGNGLSGEVRGLRGRLAKASLGKFGFDQVLAAFPDSVSLNNLPMVNDRLGSVGGEILKRFDVVFDYVGQSIYLKPNQDLHSEFSYNMSGLSIENDGFRWVQQRVANNPVGSEPAYSDSKFSFTYELKPSYHIVTVREDSPAALAGLKKGDVLVSLNGREAHRYSLHEIMALLKSEEGRRLKIKVNRSGQIITTFLRLRKML